MSQALRGKNDWLRDHYEKIIFLVALVALFISCILVSQWILADKDHDKPNLARIGWKGEPVKIKDTLPFEEALDSARKEATVALTVPERSTISEVRVACIKCGKPIPYSALSCPFCLAEQPPIINVDTVDTDGDGIPDKVELALGLNPQDPADAAGDLDNDGFTNLEEYLAKTDPRNPENFPDPIVKLRVAAIRPVPFYLRFVSTSLFGDGSTRFQLNLQSLERTYFVKLEDDVLGYQVTKYNPTAPEGESIILVRKADKHAVRLVKGRPVTEQELAILFVNLIDRQPLRPPKRLNDVFAFRNKEYKVIDIQPASVVIQETTTGDKVTVPVVTSAEKDALNPSAAAANLLTAAPGQ
ncbi:MAG TPA: hypothetical protein PKI64_04045 [Kiritimatiellia bacterium]|nr:hypothetical protein [Kiritimatiellia bacterium]